jgi:hypothetical protein
MIAADWIEKYRLHRVSQGMDEDTWKRHYWAAYKKLPLDQLLTETNILEAVLQSAPNSRTRKYDCIRINSLTEFTGVAVNLDADRGNYSPRKAKPRELPTDEEIIRVRENFLKGRVRVEAWRWQNVYSLMACYGLRPDEVFYCEVDPNPPMPARFLKVKLAAGLLCHYIQSGRHSGSFGILNCLKL